MIYFPGSRFGGGTVERKPCPRQHRRAGGRSHLANMPVTPDAAFTLLELVVVAAVLALLVLALIPVHAGNKPNSQAFQCLNNLHQWGRAMQITAQDNKDMFPRDGTDDSSQYSTDTAAVTGPGSPNDEYAWFNVAPAALGEKPFSNYWSQPGGNPYAKLPFPGRAGRIWHCPTAKAADSDVFLQNGSFGFFSYAFNGQLKATTPISGSYGRLVYPTMPTVQSVPKPSSTVLMAEQLFSPTFETLVSSSSRNGSSPSTDHYYFPSRHNDAGVIVFADGHSAMFQRGYITNGAPNHSGANRAEKRNPDVIWNIFR